MRFGALLAAVTALWVQPASAATTFSGTLTPGVFGGLAGVLPVSGGQIRYTYDLAFSAPVSNVSIWLGGYTTYSVTDRFGNYYGGNDIGDQYWTYSFAGPVSQVSFRYTPIDGLKRPGGGAYGPSYAFRTYSQQLRGSISASGSSPISFLGSISASAVPEPSTWAMMILGIGFTGAVLRTRRRKLRTA